MTSPDHQSGTDRCAEVALQHPQYEVIINIQGDEPFIDPEQISKVAACFISAEVQLATLIKKIETLEELNNLNSPKVIISKQSDAIYFSRTPLPYLRSQEPGEWLEHFTYFKHIGIYGYRADILQEVTKLAITPLERAESLEQLRWIENGYRIQVAETQLETHAIDIPEDLQKIDKYL